MNRQEQARILASHTDDELEELRERLFGETTDAERVNLAQPAPRPAANHVASEGGNPDPGPIDDDTYMRDFTKRFFDDDYAAHQQELPEQGAP